MLDIFVTEKEADQIIYCLLSERYAELKDKPDSRDEYIFRRIEYLRNCYKSKITPVYRQEPGGIKHGKVGF